MFDRIAEIVLDRRWRWVPLGLWPIAVALVLLWPASLTQLTVNDQKSFVGSESSSATGQQLLTDHFPGLAGTSAAVVIYRKGGPLTEGDLRFLDQRAGQVAAEAGKDPSTGLRLDRSAGPVEPSPARPAPLNLPAWPRYFQQFSQWAARRVTNTYLISADHEVAIASFHTGDYFLSRKTTRAVDLLRRIFAENVPEGLKVYVTGSAGLGHDYAAAVESGLNTTNLIALAAVLVVLIAMYRSPVAILVPLVTIGISVVLTLKAVTALALAGLKVPSIVESAVIVIVYGSGTDYCLFLIARFREEVAADPSSVRAAARRAAAATGPAIAASAGTTAVGVILMGLSTMPSLSSTGFAMSIGLVIAMLVTLTFTPVLLSLLGRGLFWPTSISRLRPASDNKGPWAAMGRLVTRAPGRILLGSLVVLLGLGSVVLFMPVTYDTPSALAPGAESLVGMHRIGEHFRPGEVAPVQMAIVLPAAGGASRPASAPAAPSDEWIKKLTRRLLSLEGVSDVRSPAEPFGVTLKLTRDWQAGRAGALQEIPYATAAMTARGQYAAADGRALRLEVVLAEPPFSLAAMDTMDHIRSVTAEAIRSLPAGTRAGFTGSTADIGDIRNTTRRELPIIGSLVLLAVGAIVFWVLRDLLMSAVMILATVLTVAATLGAIYLIFHHFVGTLGVDWKVAFILFVLLIAMGVDYNIYLATRIREQRRSRELKPAVTIAVRRTGAVIASCGIVVAGTFAALTATPLLLMIEWGSAMALGILLDTFIVHPLLIPAFVVRFNRLKPKRASSATGDPDPGTTVPGSSQP